MWELVPIALYFRYFSLFPFFSSLLFLHRFSLPQLPLFISPLSLKLFDSCTFLEKMCFFFFYHGLFSFPLSLSLLSLFPLYFSLAPPFSFSCFFEDFWLEFSHFYPFFVSSFSPFPLHASFLISSSSPFFLFFPQNLFQFF